MSDTNKTGTEQIDTAETVNAQQSVALTDDSAKPYAGNVKTSAAEKPEDFALADAPQDADGGDGSAKVAADRKEENRVAYEARKARQEADNLRKQLEEYKRREDEQRKATMTETERLKEELALIRDERDREKRKNLVASVAAEFGIPPALQNRILGDTEEDMRRDAEDLKRYVVRSRAGSATEPAREAGGKLPTYTREQLRRDPVLARSDDVRRAMAEGRIIG